jgi:hypothetical protein
VQTICDAAPLRAGRRARAAGISVSDATEDLLDRFRREFEPITELAGEHVRVQTTRPLSSQVQAVVEILTR